MIGGLILAAHFTVGLNFFVVSPLLPLIIEDYGISRTTASLLIVLALLLHAGLGLPGGVVVARFGAKGIFAVSWFLMGALALSALAPNFLSMLALRLCYGAGFGLIIPATGPLIMQWFRPKEVTIMNALFIASLSLGVATSVSAAAPLANAVGWENALGVFGGVGLLGAVAWSLLGKADGASSVNATISIADVLSVLRNRTILLLVAADALVLMQYTALTSWLPTFFNESRGMSLNQAGFATGVLPFVGVFAVLVGGVLPLRVESRKPFFIIPGILVGLGGLGSFLFDNTVGIYASVIILGIGSWSYAPVMFSIPMNLPGVTQEKVAVIWGTFATVPGIGMFLSPIILGAIRDATGTFVPGFTIFAIGAWFLLITGIFLPNTNSGKRAHEGCA